jgi:hypothetical protein
LVLRGIVQFGNSFYRLVHFPSDTIDVVRIASRVYIYGPVHACDEALIVLLFLPQYRRLGWYAVIVSTTATLTSFVLSTAVLYFAAKAADPTMKWSGLAVIGTYVLAIAVGIAVGGVAGAILTRKLLSGGKRASTD